jgi:hypothetical protein
MSSKMSVRPGPPRFDRDTYAAPADEDFTIELTNSAPAWSAGPMLAILLISPSYDSVITPVPGQPAMSLAIVGKAVFKAPTVPAATTKSVIVPALPAGEYVVQLREGWGLHDGAALLVRRQRAINVPVISGAHPALMNVSPSSPLRGE